MTDETTQKKSQLIHALREGVGLIQMILFKEVRNHLEKKISVMDSGNLSLLAGSITNEVFGTPNPEERFARFRKENWGAIEQELLGLKDHLGQFCDPLTDALRVQTLCDHQEGTDNSTTLIKAKEIGILNEDREIPLPSVFMTTVREIGQTYNLITAPVQISPDDDKSLIH